MDLTAQELRFDAKVLELGHQAIKQVGQGITRGRIQLPGGRTIPRFYG